MLIRSTAIALSLTLTGITAAFGQTSDVDAKKAAQELIEKRIEEVGKIKGGLAQLEKDIAETKDSLSKAKRTRTIAYFAWGIPAAGLLLTTIALERYAFFSKVEGGDFGAAIISVTKSISFFVGLGTGAGAAGTGYVFYLRLTAVNKIQTKLTELEDLIQHAKTNLEAKEKELQELKKTIQG